MQWATCSSLPNIRLLESWGFTLGVLQSGREDGWILDLAVHRDAQRLGVGWRLASVLVDTSFKKGADRLYLHVRPSNIEAIGLYKRLGFLEIRSLPDYFGPGAGRLIMCLDRSREREGG